MTDDGHATTRAEHVHDGEHTPVTLRLHRTHDRLELRWADDAYITTPRQSQFDVTVVTLRGAVDGTWTEGATTIGDSIIIAADEHTTRLAPLDLSRHLAIPTEPLHDALVASSVQHATVPLDPPLFVPGDEPVPIDVGIADLIQDLWTLDCETNNCCENQDGSVVIGFLDGYSAEYFTTIVAAALRPTDPNAPTDLEGLYNRIVINDEPEDWRAFRENRAWQFTSGWPHDYRQSWLAIPVSIRFPRTDLPTVKAAIHTAATSAAPRTDGVGDG